MKLKSDNLRVPHLRLQQIIADAWERSERYLGFGPVIDAALRTQPKRNEPERNSGGENLCQPNTTH